jgi:hypothetical protein
LATGVAGCSTGVESGAYTFTLQPNGLHSDVCHLYDGGLWSGDINTAGYTLYVDYALNSVELRGTTDAYWPGHHEEFSLDGTGMNVTAAVHGADGQVHPCPATYVQVHMDATVADNTHFSGNLQVSYTLSPDAADQVACVQQVPEVCNLNADFTAAKTP